MKIRICLTILSVVSLFVPMAAAASGHATSDDTNKKRPMTVEDVLAIKSVGDVQLGPDGSRVAYVVTERNFDENINDSDLWVVGTDDPQAVRLTYHKGDDRTPSWSPDGSWLAFLSKRGKNTEVFGIQPNGGEAWPVVEWKTSINSFRISPDGKQIAFIAKPEKNKEQKEFEEQRGRPMVWDQHYADQWNHLWVAPLKGRMAGEAVQASSDGRHVTSFVWGPDSKSLAFAARPSPTLRTSRQGAIYVIDEVGAEAWQMVDLPGRESPVAWTQDHGLIISGTGKVVGTFNRQLWQVPSAAGDPVSLTKGLDEHAGFVAITAKSLLIEATQRTGRGLFQIPLQGGKAVGQPERLTGDKMYHSGFSSIEDGSKVAFLSENGSAPPDVYFASTANLRPKKLTDMNSHVSQFQLGDQSVVRWKSRAVGEEIEGILTLPVGYKNGDRVPLLLVIHGGPAGVSVDRFTASRGAYPVQVFAGQGYAVLQPNYRGSTGYGERFRGLNRGDISGRDWIDIDSGVDEMIRRGIADPERLGVMGWSFGGHHTYWGITQTDRYIAASAGAGANDLISMYSQTDIPEFYHTYLGPKPWEDFKLYEERSAYRNVTKVTTPLLIQVGEKDERVPAEQSIQFFEAVRAIGKAETELVIYPGQPHGIRDPRLRRDLLIRNLEWFRRWIPVEGTN
jgi:dipeptidyl aminopeptidase/acylaminoacyl peptidase